MTVHLDTLAIAGKLKAAEFSKAQAEAMTLVMRDAREEQLSQLATKSDLDVLRLATKADISDLGRDIEVLRRDIDSQSNEQELRLVARIEAGKAETIEWVLSAIGFQALVTVAAVAALSRSFQP